MSYASHIFAIIVVKFRCLSSQKAREVLSTAHYYPSSLLFLQGEMGQGLIVANVVMYLW